jgi:cold-inducible RNA-binding protein
MNIYVSNLAASVTEDALKSLFQGKGEVSSVKIITDKFTRESRGFGFVEMPNAAEAENAIKELNGYQLEGRTLRVNQARERDESAPRRPGGGGFGGQRREGGGFGGRGGGSRGGGWGGGGGNRSGGWGG